MKLAVVVTTYNRPDALEAVINAFANQTDTSFELLIADDGSTVETRKLVADMSQTTPFSIKHIWHEDDGFQAAKIRNKAAAATKADYIVFTDGDCIPLNNFVARHKKLAEKGWFVCGNRVLLSKLFTDKLLSEHSPTHQFTFVEFIKLRIHGHINRLLPLLFFPIPRKCYANSWQGVKTCNLGLWREDFIMINGFDEEYAGWGMEDSDLAVRLFNAGIRRKSGRFSAPVLHLWHIENDRGWLKENILRFEALLTSKRIKATTGFDQHASAE